MDIKRLIKCGHIGYAETTDGKPYCLICDCDKLEDKKENIPNLTGRKAKCDNCTKIVDSSFGLPFFEYNPNHEYDSFVCGCMGWD